MATDKVWKSVGSAHCRTHWKQTITTHHVTHIHVKTISTEICLINSQWSNCFNVNATAEVELKLGQSEKIPSDQLKYFKLRKYIVLLLTTLSNFYTMFFPLFIPQYCGTMVLKDNCEGITCLNDCPKITIVRVYITHTKNFDKYKKPFDDKINFKDDSPTSIKIHCDCVVYKNISLK